MQSESVSTLGIRTANQTLWQGPPQPAYPASNSTSLRNDEQPVPGIRDLLSERVIQDDAPFTCRSISLSVITVDQKARSPKHRILGRGLKMHHERPFLRIRKLLPDGIESPRNRTYHRIILQGGIAAAFAMTTVALSHKLPVESEITGRLTVRPWHGIQMIIRRTTTHCKSERLQMKTISQLGSQSQEKVLRRCAKAKFVLRSPSLVGRNEPQDRFNLFCRSAIQTFASDIF
jgi:hypothetical protein